MQGGKRGIQGKAMPAASASVCLLLEKLPKPWQGAPLTRGGHLTGGQTGT